MPDGRAGLDLAPHRSLHDRLRQETRAAHEAVEQAFDMVRATETVDTYVAAMMKMHAAYAGVHAALQAMPSASGADAARSAKLAAERILGDLAFFGAHPGGIAPSQMTLRDAGEALGCEYVMRGSSLGGLVIFKFAATRLGITKEHGGSFFYGEGDATKSRWLDFQSRLSKVRDDDSFGDQVVLGALKTFDHFAMMLGERHRSHDQFG